MSGGGTRLERLLASRPSATRLAAMPTILRIELEAAEAEACIESAAGQNSTTIAHLPGRRPRGGRQQPSSEGAHVHSGH